MNQKVSYLPTVSTVSYGTGRSGTVCRESCEREKRAWNRARTRATTRGDATCTSRAKRGFHDDDGGREDRPIKISR